MLHLSSGRGTEDLGRFLRPKVRAVNPGLIEIAARIRLLGFGPNSNHDSLHSRLSPGVPLGGLVVSRPLRAAQAARSRPTLPCLHHRQLHHRF